SAESRWPEKCRYTAATRSGKPRTQKACPWATRSACGATREGRRPSSPDDRAESCRSSFLVVAAAPRFRAGLVLWLISSGGVFDCGWASASRLKRLNVRKVLRPPCQHPRGSLESCGSGNQQLH